MTVVLVHGVPETAAVWDLLVPELVAAGVEEPVRLSPPGFGARTPQGWRASPDAYRDWLVGELEAVVATDDRPVDLVGHDWGGGHVLNVAMTRPDLLRSWVSDIVGAFDPDYVWHDLAQRWQSSEGEKVVESWIRLTDGQRADNLVAAGMDAGVAARVSPAIDATMGACILDLYRAADQPSMARRGAGLEAAAARPGLSILPSEDHLVGTDEQRRRAAARAGSQIVELDGLGHWWMTTDPARGAQVLTDFWSSVSAQR